MANYEVLFENEEDIFGGTPASKYHDITSQANSEIVKDEFDKIVEKFAIMEAMLEELDDSGDLDKKIAQYALEHSEKIENMKKSLYIEFTGNIVMRLDS
jgi:hypothetical protein